MFKRQGVIDLHMAWQGVNDLDVNNLITANTAKAAECTAVLNGPPVVQSVIMRTVLGLPQI